MRISHFTKVLGLMLFLATASPVWANKGGDIVAESKAERAVQLNHRLEEIKGLDKSTLSKHEKKALRREVREIKKELAAISGGVYLSIGAIILIALLLILLL